MGSCCGPHCGWCGGCTDWYDRPAFDDVDEEPTGPGCEFCGLDGCGGECLEAIEALQDGNDAEHETWRDGQLG